MTDTELLRLAAKGAGYAIHAFRQAERDRDYPEQIGLWIPSESTCWNPLIDSGHALRLAVKVQLTVANEHVNAGVAYCMREDEVFSEVHSGSNESEVIESDYAATRRAIVLAAAKIGESK